MKRKILDIIVIAIILGLGLTTYINSKTIDVDTYQSRKGKVTSIVRIEGEVLTKKIEDILYANDCIVEEFYVSDGQEVRVGDPVFRINIAYDKMSKDQKEAELKLELAYEKNKLDMLVSGQSNIEYKKLQLLKTNMEDAHEELKNNEVLFEAGVITKDKITQLSKAYESYKINYLEEQVTYNSSASNNELQRQSLEEKIKNIEKQLIKIDLDKSQYASVDEEGIYYSQHRGVINNTIKTGQILSKDAPISTLAVTGDVSNYLFVGAVSDDYSVLLDEGDAIDFYDGVIREPIKGSITKVYDLVENGKIRVEADFLEDRAAKVGYGKSFYSVKVIDPIFDHVIPKNCIIGNVAIQVEDRVDIFIVENNIAKRVQVKILAVGDKEIGIENPDGLNLDSIIIDPSYKIKDGDRVR